MGIRRFIAVTAAVLAAAVLTCCTSLSLNGPDILTPPRAAGSRAELQSLIEQDAGGSYTFITPAAGEYKSGVTMHDFDGDGVEEAAALYTAANGTARLLIAAVQGNSYRLVDSCELSSANVGRISFADVDADGMDELFIGCDTGSPAAKLSVCFITDKIEKEDISEGFSGFVTGDFDGNSASDVLILFPVNVEAAAKASLTVYSDGAFTEKSSCEIDPDIAAYARLSFGAVNASLSGAFIDGVNEDGKYTTQLVYYDPSTHSLINPLLIYSVYDKTLRSSKIFSSDVNGDGTTEIPFCETMAHTKDEDASQVCTAVRWCSCEPKQMTVTPVSEAVLCDAMGFMLTLRPDTLDTVTARCADRSSMTLYSLRDGEAKSVLGQQLLTVKYYDKGDFDSSQTVEMVICESETGIYTCLLSDGAGFTYDEIINSFKLTKDI